MPQFVPLFAVRRPPSGWWCTYDDIPMCLVNRWCLRTVIGPSAKNIFLDSNHHVKKENDIALSWTLPHHDADKNLAKDNAAAADWLAARGCIAFGVSPHCTQSTVPSRLLHLPSTASKTPCPSESVPPSL